MTVVSVFCRFTMTYLLPKENLPRPQESLERDCLDHRGQRLLKVCDSMKSFK